MEFFQLLHVHGIQTLTAGNIFTDQSINLRRRSAMWQAGMNDHRLGARLRRKVAFVADTNDFAVQAQSEENLRGRRQQRNDTHEERHSSTIPDIRHRANDKRRTSLQNSMEHDRNGSLSAQEDSAVGSETSVGRYCHDDHKNLVIE